MGDYLYWHMVDLNDKIETQMDGAEIDTGKAPGLCLVEVASQAALDRLDEVCREHTHDRILDMPLNSGLHLQPCAP